MGGLHPIPRDSIDNDVMAMLDGINKRSKRETFLITSSGPSHPHLMLFGKRGLDSLIIFTILTKTFVRSLGPFLFAPKLTSYRRQWMHRMSKPFSIF